MTEQRPPWEADAERVLKIMGLGVDPIEADVWGLDSEEFAALWRSMFLGSLTIRPRPSSALLRLYVSMRFSMGSTAVMVRPSPNGTWKVVAAVRDKSWLSNVVRLLENEPSALIERIEPVGIVVAGVSCDRADSIVQALLRVSATDAGLARRKGGVRNF